VEEIVEDKHHIGNGTRFMNAKYTLKVTKECQTILLLGSQFFYLLFHGTDRIRELAKNGSMHRKFSYGAKVSLLYNFFAWNQIFTATHICKYKTGVNCGKDSNISKQSNIWKNRKKNQMYRWSTGLI
jgi:hypothetical protein